MREINFRLEVHGAWMTAKVFFVLCKEGHLRLKPMITKIGKITNLACVVRKRTDLKAARTALADFFSVEGWKWTCAHTRMEFLNPIDGC